MSKCETSALLSEGRIRENRPEVARENDYVHPIDVIVDQYVEKFISVLSVLVEL